MWHTIILLLYINTVFSIFVLRFEVEAFLGMVHLSWAIKLLTQQQLVPVQKLIHCCLILIQKPFVAAPNIEVGTQSPNVQAGTRETLSGGCNSNVVWLLYCTASTLEPRNMKQEVLKYQIRDKNSCQDLFYVIFFVFYFVYRTFCLFHFFRFSVFCYFCRVLCFPCSGFCSPVVVSIGCWSLLPRDLYLPEGASVPNLECSCVYWMAIREGISMTQAHTFDHLDSAVTVVGLAPY